MMKFTIIIPIYKTKEHDLKRCIESILSQSYSDIELILVDDGSPDRCGEIIDAYAKQDPRIIAIHQENQGVSSARNCGLDMASGEYVLFVDADDVLLPETLQHLDIILKDQESVDMIYFYYQTVLDSHSKSNSDYKADKLSMQEIQLWFSANIKRMDLCKSISIGSPWGKAISMEFIHKHGLRFPVGVPLSEDRVFIANCLSLAQNVVLVNLYGYYYNTENSTSVMHQFNPEVLDKLELAGALLEQIVDQQTYLSTAEKIELCTTLRLSFMGEWRANFFLHNQAKMPYSQMKNALEQTYRSVVFQGIIQHRKDAFAILQTRSFGVGLKTIIRLLMNKRYVQLYLLRKILRAGMAIKRCL